MISGRSIWILAAAALCVSLCSCSVTRHIPDGSYLLKRNEIRTDKQTPKKDRITAPEIDTYIQQSPNKRFLGINLNAWIYAQANPEKTSGWHRFLRRLGEEPVIWDPLKTRQSVQYLETYMASRGFFEGIAWYDVDTVRGSRVRVTYGLGQGPAWRIASIKYDFRDRFLEPVVMRDSAATLLRTGDVFDIGVMDAERLRITTNLKNLGYYNFDVGNITFTADSTRGNRLIDLTMVVHRHLESYRDDGSPVYANNRIYRIRDIYIRPDYDPLADYGMLGYLGRLDTVNYRGVRVVFDRDLRIRPKILQRALKFGPNYLYSSERVSASSMELMRLGVFRSASILFDPLADEGTESRVTYVGGDAQATETTSEGYLRCDIRCVPALRQSYKIDLEGSVSSSFYGLRTTLGYQNRNLFRGAELFDASLTAGFEFLKSSTRKISYELGGAVSLTFPRFIGFGDIDRRGKARSPSTKLALSTNWQDRVYYRRTLFGLNWGYSWGSKRYQNFTVRPVDISLVKTGFIDSDFELELDNPYLLASYRSQIIAGLSASYVYNNQPRDLNAGATVLRWNVETTGNLLSGLSSIFSRPTDEGHYNVLGIQFSQYVRSDVSFSRKIMLGEKSAFAYRVYGGAIYSYGNSDSPPVDRMFFAGGINSMRGWSVRTLGPGTQLYEKKSYPAQMGDVKLEANIEFRFPIWYIFRGAVFCDAGNIWYMRRSDIYPDEAVFHFRSFYRQLGFNTGLGLRLDMGFAVIRLDWGIQLHSPGLPEGERWISGLRWSKTALNFGVGYPF